MIFIYGSITCKNLAHDMTYIRKNIYVIKMRTIVNVGTTKAAAFRYRQKGFYYTLSSIRGVGVGRLGIRRIEPYFNSTSSNLMMTYRHSLLRASSFPYPPSPTSVDNGRFLVIEKMTTA